MKNSARSSGKPLPVSEAKSDLWVSLEPLERLAVAFRRSCRPHRSLSSPISPRRSCSSLWISGRGYLHDHRVGGELTP